ncbi:MAG: hypothetical protein ABW219_03495 [Ilumatobacteraceae bacterium]
MALRIDLYAVDPEVDLESIDLDVVAEPRGVAWLGLVSASDADEDRLIDLLRRAADAGCLDGAAVQGVGPASEIVDPASVRRFAAVPADDEPVAAWRDTLLAAIERVVAGDRHLGWRTRYDRGGSLADGTDEWITEWQLGSA